jgi:hypothetical protein
MNSIDGEAFQAHAPDFVDIVKFGYRSSEEYINARAEYEELKKTFVCLKPVYPMLWSNVSNYRKKVGLPL